MIFMATPWRHGAVTKAMALQVIDLLLHFGLSELPGFLLEEAVQARCRFWVVVSFFCGEPSQQKENQNKDEPLELMKIRNFRLENFWDWIPLRIHIIYKFGTWTGHEPLSSSRPMATSPRWRWHPSAVSCRESRWPCWPRHRETSGVQWQWLDHGISLVDPIWEIISWSNHGIPFFHYPNIIKPNNHMGLVDWSN